MPEPSSRRGPAAAAASSLWRAVAAPLFAAALVAVMFLQLLGRDPLLCWKDDLVISIMPVFADVARAWQHGEWPLLSPFSWASGNLAGEYQYGTFSPAVNLPVIAAFLLPLALPAKAALLGLSQLVLLAGGACLLGRRRNVGAAGGVCVAVIGALNGWNVAWGATDWFGALAANAWLPWCWWAFEEALESGVRSWWRRWLVPSLCVYLLAAAGFPYTLGMLALVSAWLALRAWVEASGRPWLPRLLTIWPLAVAWALGLGLAAPAWLSLFAYIPGSDRAHGVNVVPTAWSVPWSAWPALVLPTWRTAWPDFAALPVRRYGIELAGGLVPLALLAASFARAGWRAVLRRCGWELALTAIVLALCMLPSPGIFRWSFRWLPLLAVALSLAAVRSVDPAENQDRRWLSQNAGVWATVLVIIVWLGTCLENDVPTKASLVGGGTLVLALAWAAGEKWLTTPPGRWLPAAAAVFSLLLVYNLVPANKDGANIPRLGTVNDPSVPVYAIGPNIASPAPLSTDRLYLCLSLEPYLRYRDWQTAPNFGALIRPGSTSMFAGVHLVNGYSPIMAAAIGRHLEMETHGNIPERIGATLLAAGSDGDALLAHLGVDGLIISFDYPLRVPPPAAEWELVFSSPEGQVYHRRSGLIAAVRAANDAPGFGPATITQIVDHRQSVSARVDVPGGGKSALVSFRRPLFSGYRATLNGNPVPVISKMGYMPMVSLPPGSHGYLELAYQPRALAVGSVLAALSLLILVASGLLSRRRREVPGS
jgi:hypothetical protein